MANNKVYVSPGVFTSEKDLSFVAQQVGVTTLGSVGETMKGPAFEPIFITNYEEFTTIFGGLSPEKFADNKPKYELPYIAKNYLTESNQLFVTRILGLTGYDAGYSWLITAKANYDPETITSATTTTWTADFSGGTVYFNFSGGIEVEQLYNLNLFPNQTSSFTTSIIPNNTTSYPQGIVFTEIGGSFTGISATIEQTYFSGGSGSVSGTITTYTAAPFADYDGIVLATLRSRAKYVNDQLLWDTKQSTTGVTLTTTHPNFNTNPLTEFVLSAVNNITNTSVNYDVSLDSTKRNYITRVLGTDCFDKDSLIYVEEFYPNLLKHLISNNLILSLNSGLISTENFNNYKQGWQTPETPWVVSELRGNVVDKLFKFISVSDGNSANAEIKISIQNIKPDTKEFDIIIRDFNDTDAKPLILESFRKCSMNPSLDNYIARRIGTADGEFSLRSRYVMIVENPNAPIDSFPAGFEGYVVRDYDSGVLAPKLIYKTAYNPITEKIRKTYLGLSNITGIDQNMFNWKGYTPNPNGSMWTATTKGFHMDVDAEIAGNFEVGDFEFRTVLGIQNTDYESINARKFTLAPYLGFDGWNIYRTSRTNTDRYKIGSAGFNTGIINGEFTQISQTEGTSDYYAYLEGIRTFENPESVNINVFTVSNIDYSDNTDLVSETIDMIEEERSDSIFILTSPEGVVYNNSSQLTGIGYNSIDIFSSEDMVDLLDSADLDSNYTATYWPWIQTRDRENKVNVWLPPTYEVVRNIALTDNISFPWFATAGYTRGKTNAIQARVKLTEQDRDVLYEGRINPMATFSDQGVVIWGNKNLQLVDSALDRLNIRRLLLQTRKLISAVSVRLLFEQNDQIIRNQFLTLVNPILENIRRERGLVDFRVQLSNDPEEIDRNELRGKIFIKPVPSLEFIILEFNVTSTGASFDDI